MKIFLTGGTGFIGRALALRLRGGGHQVVAWVRDLERARDLLGSEPSFATGDEAALAAAMEGCDAVVHLAGEPVLPGRWTRARKQRLRDSRVAFTERLVRVMGALKTPPATFVSASAVGFYGDGGAHTLTEASAPGAGFLAALCVDWEAAARGAERLGVRTVTPRIGLVLGEGGGVLGPMLPAFRLCVGGPIGSGAQAFPWIHLDDVLEALVWFVERPGLSGAYNLTAPSPCSQREFAGALGRRLGRPAVVPAPAFALRWALGEAASALLEGQRAVPTRLLEAGFVFRHPTLDSALSACIPNTQDCTLGAVPDGPPAFGAETLRGLGPNRSLRTAQDIDRPMAEVAAFFGDVRQLGALSPAELGLRTRGEPPAMAVGAALVHGMHLGPIPMTWRGRIVAMQPGEAFVDVQDSGPYSCWWHLHRFEALGPDRTRVHDEVRYAAPLGPIGRLAGPLFIEPKLREIFLFRRRAIERRFSAGRAA
jgi:uncharacterized protein (TIGR01777 family)